MKISKEFKVGLLATIVLTIFYLGFTFLKGKNLFSTRNTYYVIYEHSNGLVTSSPVLIHGLAVGRVQNIKILSAKNYRVWVALEVDKNIQLTDATTAKLISSGELFGGKAIELIVHEGNPLKNHSILPGQLDTSLNDIKDISLLIKKVTANLAENTDKINALFADLGEATKALKQLINGNQKEISLISKNLSEVSQALADQAHGIKPFLTTIHQLAAELQHIQIKPAAEKLDTILSNVENILVKTTQGKNSLHRLLHSDALYDNFNNTLVDLDQLLIDLKRHPERYINFSLFGGPKKQQGCSKK